MKLYLVLFCCAVLVDAATRSGTSFAADHLATLSAAQVKEGILRSQRLIKSVHVVYEATASDGTRRGEYLHREIAMSGPCSMFHLSAHGDNQLKWEDDPLQQAAYIDAATVTTVYPLDRHYTRREYEPKAPLPGTLSTELFIIASGVWPLASREAPKTDDGRPVVLMEIAQSAAHCSVRRLQEKVGGVWCHVLEDPGRDVLWIDPERGFCLLRREIYDEETGAIMSRYTHGGHRQVADGIWLPQWIKNEQFDFTAESEIDRRRKVADSHSVLRILAVNDVPCDRFVYLPPAGALGFDMRGSETDEAQSHPGAIEHLDSLANWIRRNRRAMRQPQLSTTNEIAPPTASETRKVGDQSPRSP